MRRDFPCPGDGGRRIPRRPAGWPIIFAAWAATALAGVITLCTAVGR